MKNKLFTTGQVREIPANVEETRTIPFVISDDSKDRHSTVLSTDGWDLEAYNRNGIVGYMQKRPLRCPTAVQRKLLSSSN